MSHAHPFRDADAFDTIDGLLHCGEPTAAELEEIQRYLDTWAHLMPHLRKLGPRDSTDGQGGGR